MKKVYERPLMKAQVFAVNKYVAACTNPNLLGGSINTAQATGWYNVPRGTSGNPLSAGAFENSGYLTDIKFTGQRVPQTSQTTGGQQYYWAYDDEKTGDRYYLEYSDGWTQKYAKNGGTGSVFVLYREDSYAQRYPDNTEVLDINWTGFAGSLSDNSSTDKYDDAFALITFDTNKIYWS